MANSMVKINVHSIFHIKLTSVQMDAHDLPRIFEYIGGILKNLGAIPFVVGGVSNHVHFLSTLPSTISMAEMMRTVKAKSSKWIKSLSPAYATFAWQDGYAAFSVSASVLERTIDYIRNQEEHHQMKTYVDELKTLLDAYQISYDEKFIFND